MINGLIRVLIKMRLLIFLVLSQYELLASCKYGINGCRIESSNTWYNNCQLGKNVTEN